MMDMWNLGSDARRSAVKVARCMAEMVSGQVTYMYCINRFFVLRDLSYTRLHVDVHINSHSVLLEINMHTCTCTFRTLLMLYISPSSLLPFLDPFHSTFPLPFSLSLFSLPPPSHYIRSTVMIVMEVY